MYEVLKKVGEIGVVPVVKIEKASDAAALGRALLAGDLPLAEITFRTAAAEEAIKILSRDCPELLVGAGTVLTTDQVDRAVAAGARFIVAPGFNPRVVDYCISKGVPVTPGISSPSEIEMGLERGLDVLKFFPAGASGGLEYLKSIAAPYAGVQFVPTGGVEPGNIKEYLSFNRVLAVGGTWIAKEAAISAGKFDEITRLAREAVVASLGFELAHLGINESDAPHAMTGAQAMEKLFSFAVKDGNSSTFAGTFFEFMKKPFLGTHGHIAVSTLSLPRAVAWLSRKGVGVKPETAKEKDGRTIAVYLDREVSGFAVHLLQK
jgi:2-dehydro-3-deoxyphosphogluconate aldolase / (4S)-4-hydroxy-2-oxoglutarate aldolase